MSGRKMRRGMLAAAGMGLLAGGCTTTLFPPVVLEDPVPIVFVDHGYTPSLVVPVDEEGEVLARYAYGDWRWYAEGRQGAFDFLRAVFLPSRGALGRRFMKGPAEVDNVLQVVLVEVADAYLLHVERKALREFNAYMEKIFEGGVDSLLDSRRVDLTFVHHPRRYHMFFNSNHAAAHWLGLLGIAVKGPAMLSHWRVVQPPAVKD